MSSRTVARIGIGIGLAVVLAGVLASVTLGVEPSAMPSALPADVLGSGDLRSEGEGPGLVGNPLLILGGVVALGAATAGITVAIVRLLGRDR